MAKTFQQMNKEELIKLTTSLGLLEEVQATAADVNNITNPEYVAVLKAYKDKQAELNKDISISNDSKKEKEDIEKEVKENTKVVVDAFKRAELKQVKYKYIVTDHQNRATIQDDDETRVFPISYGNINSGPRVWNVALHGREQALPISVAKRLEEIKMIVQTNDGEGKPITKSQSRFRVTKIDGWTQDEIEALKRSQNTRKFRD